MAPELFDMRLRAMRRDRAKRRGPETFLYERAFEDCRDRLAVVHRRFGSALMIGCPDSNWPARLREHAAEVQVADPGPLFAASAGGSSIVEDQADLGTDSFDLCLAIGTLDTVNDVRSALRSIRHSLRPDSLLIGAVVGGDSLPQLRSAMRAADAAMSAASPHVHPRIEAAALAPLLSEAGFVMPVVDVDRVQVAYESLARLVEDLRAMGATNVLAQRNLRPLTKAAWLAASAAFENRAGSRTIEKFEILHFAAWTPVAEIAPAG